MCVPWHVGAHTYTHGNNQTIPIKCMCEYFKNGGKRREGEGRAREGRGGKGRERKGQDVAQW